MNYKKQIGIVAGVLLAVLSGIWMVETYTPGGLCDYDVITGLKYFNCVAEPAFQVIGLFLIAIIIFLFPLYFLKEGVYLSWRKFALWYLPIAIIFILLVGGSGSGGFNPGYGFDTESLTFFFSGLFAVISLILIIYKSIALRGKDGIMGK